MSKRLLVVAVVLSVATPARADQALELVRQAQAKLKMADFNGSMELLGQARSQTHDPKVLGQIYLYLGLNHAVMGDLAKAKPAFRTALTYDPVLVLNPTHIKQSVVKLFGDVQAGLRGELTVRASRPGAKVFVDGKPVGSAPLKERELPIGAHVIEVRGGGAVFRKRVVIGVNQKTEVQAVLRGGEQPREDPGAPVKAVADEPADEGAPRGRRRIWTWVAGGAAVVALAVGVGLGAAASSDHSDWEQEQTDPARWDALKSSGQDKATAANVMFGVGGGLAAAAVVLFFLEGRGGSAPEQGATRVVPMLGRGAGIGLTGSF